MRKKLMSIFMTVLLVLVLWPLPAAAENPPNLIGAAVWRSEAATAAVRFISDAQGTCYYKITDNDTPPADIAENGTSGGNVTANVTTTLSLSGLSAGEKYVHIIVKDSTDSVSNPLTIAMPSDYYYFENFEAYELDTYIASDEMSPLSQKNSGTGSENQAVVSNVSNNSEKMLTLSSNDGWASDQQVQLNPSTLAASSSYAFEGDVYPLVDTGLQLRFSFTDHTYGEVHEAGVFFNDGKITTATLTNAVELKSSYTAAQWHHIKIVATPSTQKYTVYVDGELLSSTLPLPADISRLAISAGNLVSNTTAYFDNLKFYLVPAAPGVCAIGGTEYPDLESALTAAAGTDTIRLLSDVSYSNAIKAGAKDVTIDLNGFDLTISGVPETALQAANGYQLTISDVDQDGGTASISSAGGEKSAAYAVSGGDIVIEGTLSAAYIGGSNQNIFGAYADGTGSTIQITGAASGYTAGLYSQNNASIQVIGNVSGSYYGAFAAYGGSADITGNVTGDYALNPEYGGNIEVEGNVTGAAAGIRINSIDGWAAPSVTVTGNVTGTGGKSIDANCAGDIEITGFVTGGVYVSGATTSSPEVLINGDITAGSGCGIYIYYGGTVWVNGRIANASPYLKLDNLSITRNAYNEISGDYYKYSNQTVDTPAPFAANTVYVKKPVNPTASAVSITGDASVGQVLTGSYTYNAGSVGSEGNSAFRWLRVSGTPSLLGQPYLLYTTNNIDAVGSSPSGPTSPAQFSVTGETQIAKISNYHYGAVYSAGTISLVDSGNTVYGPWNTVNESGYWCVYPDIEVPAGSYTVVDSNPSSWSYNSASGNAGMTEITGYTVISGAATQTYTLHAGDAGQSLVFEVIPEDADGNRGPAVQSGAFGPVAGAPDTDGDGIPDAIDNAPNVSNPGQEDADGDSIGDVIDSNTVTIGMLSGGSITANPTTAVLGTTINLTITPDSGKQLKAGTLQYHDGSQNHTISGTNFTMPVLAVTISAEFENKPSGDTGSGGSSGGSSGGGSGGGVTATPTDTGSKLITITGGTKSVSGMLSNKEGGSQVVILNHDFNDLNIEDDKVTVLTQEVTVTFDKKAIDTIGAASDTGDVTITARQVPMSELSEKDKMTVGSRPVYDFTVTKGGSTVSSFDGGYATISIPYKLLPGENPNAVVVWYLSDSGKLVSTRGRYDAATGIVTFMTTHFSRFIVGHNLIAFSDTTSGLWHHDAVTFLAARGITAGTTATTFSPDATLTRGQFMVMLLRAYGIEPDINAAENFSDAGNTYYTGYLAAAKHLGITNGIGSNKFAPGNQITRQETFTLLYNAQKVLGQLPKRDSGKTLSDFTDTALIDSWAKDAITALVENGIIAGSGGSLKPTETTTRAEMAQVLYNLLRK